MVIYSGNPDRGSELRDLLVGESLLEKEPEEIGYEDLMPYLVAANSEGYGLENAICVAADSYNLDRESMEHPDTSSPEVNFRQAAQNSLGCMIEQISTAYSEIIGEETSILIDSEFAEAAMSEFEARYSEEVVSCARSAADMLAFRSESGEMSQLLSEESILEPMKAFQKEVIQDLWGENFEIPAMRGVKTGSVVEIDPDLRNDYEEGEDILDELEAEVVEKVNDKGCIKYSEQRPRYWTTSPFVAKRHSSRGNKVGGYVLRNNFRPQELMTSELVNDGFLDEAEVVPEPVDLRLESDGFARNDGNDIFPRREQELIWLFNQLDSQLKSLESSR